MQQFTLSEKQEKLFAIVATLGASHVQMKLTDHLVVNFWLNGIAD